MRKVFLSFLGTNNYIPCNYVCKGYDPVNNVRFIQEATISWYCADWNEDDSLFFFTTDKAHEKNWLDNGHKNRDNTVLECEGLKSRLSLINQTAPFYEIPIPSGKNEQEIWEIFSTVIDRIEEGDELYFDITHAFRSLPLLAMVIINYAKITKNIHVKVIGYGAMEAIGDIWQVREMDITERNVPVFNLLPFDQLLDWSTAIDKYISAGDAAGIQKLTVEKCIAFKKQVCRPDKEADSLKIMGTLLGKFSKTLATCRGKDIVQDTVGLKKAIADVQDQQLIKPLTPLLKKLEDVVSKFSGDEVQDGVAAARWCLEHNLIQQGFTLLQETMFTYILQQSTNENTSEIDKRNLVGSAIAIEQDNKPVNEWHEAARNNESLINKIRDWLRGREDLLKNMKNISHYRNDLNHAGMNDGPMESGKFEEKLHEFLEIFEEQIRLIEHHDVNHQTQVD